MQRFKTSQLFIIASALVSAGCWEPVNTCEDNASTTDACRRATSLLRYLAPQLGLQATSGNPTIGSVGALPPRKRLAMGVSVRGGAPIHAPQMNTTSTGSAPASRSYSTDDVGATLGRIDLAIGILPRIKGVVGVDFLFAAMQTPGRSLGSLEVMKSPSIAGSGGLRVGLAPDAANKRMVASFTVMVHDQSEHAFRATTPDGALLIQAMRVASSTVHIAAGKEWGRYGINAGYGRSDLSGDAEVYGLVTSSGSTQSSGPVRANHYTYGSTGFLEGTMRVRRAKVALGLSRISWTSGFAETNSFSPGDGSRRTTVSLGARFGG